MSTILRVREISKIFKLEAGLFAATGRHVWALNGVDLDIERGETYGIVGESGSGKTTLARTLVQLVSHSSGTIDYFPGAGASRGAENEAWRVSRRDPIQLKDYRADVKYIFQDPSSSLDPRMSVERILTSGARYSPRFADREGLARRTREVVEAVGLRPADLDRRPSEFSGGQRQRISLARALIHDPRILICDEVVSALDVSIQGQILNLLVDLKGRFDLTLLFIAHDLTVVSYMADRVGVMYGGSLMEEAPSARLVAHPLHPYTQLLYESIPTWERALPKRIGGGGSPYVPTVEPVGCPFAGRCPRVEEVCRREKPELRELSPGHKVACHFAEARTV
ncbi:MAG TPA: ABC transporter ATP-binding protein [Spirochaetia bacterium]|nr:ABC transporter ATP-binding protein [Spirochaetia bacterium]